MIKHIRTIVYVAANLTTFVGLMLGVFIMGQAVYSYVNHDPYAALDESSQSSDEAVDTSAGRR